MAFAIRNSNENIIGMFTEKECGNYFEYSMAEDFVLHPDMKTGRNTEYPHKVWVCEPWKHDCGWRRALVKKTVAYIVVDEADDGSAVIERWYIKDLIPYYIMNKPLSPGEKLLDKLSK